MLKHLDIVLAIVGTVILAYLMAAGISLFLSTSLAKVAYIRSEILAPILLAVVAIGAFTTRGFLFDVFFTVVFAALGWAMQKLGYSRPALFLGFVLGGLTEQYLGISLSAYGWAFVLRPICLVLIALILFSLGWEFRKNFSRRKPA